MSKEKLVITVVFLTLFAVILGGITIGLHIVKKRREQMEVIEGGTVRDNYLEGYDENIKSKDIISFSYICGDFKVSCELKDNILTVKSTGGYSNERDGKYFKLEYESKDKTILNDLQEIIEKYNLSKNNGYEHEVAGLPPELGDTLKVEYKSEEKIYRYDNQSRNLSEEASNEIYEAFHKCAKENGYDFTSEGSNVELYNDADKNYVQGTWVGTHFGSEYKVVFEGTKIKIYKDGKLTDEGWYKIVDGDIVNNKPKKGVTIAKDKNDYEEFTDISIMRKKNDFTMTMYFMKNSYSTDDLIKKE